MQGTVSTGYLARKLLGILLMATHPVMEITNVCYHVRLCHMDFRALTQIQMLLGAKPHWLIVKLHHFLYSLVGLL